MDRWATSAMSMASCTELLSQHGEAGLAAGHNVAVVAEDGQRVIGQGAGAHVEHRGAVSSPAILYMLGIISSRPWEAVKVVVRAPAAREPCTAPAAPASDCISATLGRFCPNRFLRPCGGPLVGHFRHGGRRRDGVNGCHIAERISDMADGSITVNGHFECHGCTSLTISGLSRPSRKTLGVAASFSKTRQKTREILEHINYKRSREKCQFCPREFPSFSGRVCQRKRHGSCVRMTFAQSR